MRPVVVCCALLLSVTFLTIDPAVAQWRSDSLTNTPVCIAKHAQTHPKIASDGAGGAFIVWQDIRSTYNWDIYIQHLDENGNRLWDESGRPICTATYDQYSPVITEDGYGGAFIVWEDQRNLGGSDIYAQHVNADGEISYDSNGIALGAAIREQEDPVIALIKPGRAVVAFEDHRASSSSARPDITLNVLTRDGAQYGSSGWEVVPSMGGQRQPRLIADKQGGALLAWESDHGIPGGVHASLLDSNGALKWNGGGNIPGYQIFKGLSSANYSTNIGLGLSGEKFLMTWEVVSATSNIGKDIYANRISRTGDRDWYSSLEVTTEWPSDQTNPSIFADDSGGVIVIFEDFDGDFAPHYWNRDVVMVRYRSNGDRIPNVADGFIDIVKQSRAQRFYQTLQADGRIYVTWDDGRHGNDDTAIYLQAVDASLKRFYPTYGTTSKWGKPIAVRSDAQQEHVTMCAREGGGVLLAWTDNRNGNQDIYAQVLFKDGTLPIELSAFDVLAFGSKVVVEWHTASEKDHAGFEVERRNVSTGESFKVIRSYKQTDLLKGHGDRKDASSYAIEDEPAPGIYEYRIADVALDGARTTHRAKKINTSYEVAREWKAISSFPNPASDNLTLRLQSAYDAVITVEVRDQLGRGVLTRQASASAGSRDMVLDLKSLPIGTYYYMVSASKDGALFWTSGIHKFEVIR